jgi:monofunctional biosynthetic peptidoglycan transglycosylase
VVVERRPGGVHLSLSSGQAEGRQPLRFEVSVPLAEGPVDVSLSGGPLPLDALGINEGDMGLTNVASSEFETTGSARLSADGRELSLSGSGRLANLSIHQPRLARNPVRGLSLSLAGKAELALDGSLTSLSNVELGVGKARALVSGKLARQEGHAAGDFHVEAPLSACSDVLSATPSALVPLLSGLTMTGTFTFSGQLAFDTRRPADAKVSFTGSNDCEVTQVPASLSLDRFRRPWTRTVKGQTGVTTTIESGPGTAGWVPYAEISPYMPTAVVICEDARFFSHRGFDAQSIQSSIKDNLREGRFVRGGSTVSMQLAKNLFLEREKTLSRKLQEAVLTLLLEQSLKKEEILELYLNIVEFGPGIYGIGPAAAHYFRSRPRDLSLGQALYLASILPNPKVHHFGEGGLLRPGWADYLRKLMKIAHKIHRIDDRELEIGLEETVQLGVAATADAFLGEDSRDDDAPEPDGDRR